MVLSLCYACCEWCYPYVTLAVNGIIWEPLTTANATTADSTVNVTTVDVLVLGYGLWVRV